jgi:hypothetical protein
MKRSTRRFGWILDGWLAAAILLLAFVSTGVGEESANYSMDFTRQQFGASVGESANYDIQDGIVYAQPEDKNQDSPSYDVSNAAAFSLQANNGLGSGFGTTAHLSWPPFGLPSLQGYNIYRSTTPGVLGEKINDQLVQGTAYQDRNLENGVYFYRIEVVLTGGSAFGWANIVVAISGVMDEVWVNFAWPGDQSGHSYAPFRTLEKATAWVRVGGEVKIMPGVTNETIRIDKPMRLSNPYVGDPSRIGAVEP